MDAETRNEMETIPQKQDIDVIVVATAKENVKQELTHIATTKLRLSASFLPLFVYSEDFFFSSKRYDPSIFNSWSRKNGWQRPVNILLPIVLLGFVVGAISFFVYLNRLFSGPVAYWTVNGIVGILTVVQGGAMVYTVSVDTTDDKVLQAGQQRNIEYIKVTGIPVIDATTRFCNICQVQVNEKTKHCKACNK